jgi:hypothetical protein
MPNCEEKYDQGEDIEESLPPLYTKQVMYVHGGGAASTTCCFLVKPFLGVLHVMVNSCQIAIGQGFTGEKSLVYSEIFQAKQKTNRQGFKV